MIGQVAVLEVESVHDFIAGSAAKQLLSIIGKFQPVETFVQFDPRHYFFGRQVHDQNLMVAITGVQDGRKSPTGMNSYVDRKIRQLDLTSYRPQRPLVGQQNGTIGSPAGQRSRRSTARPPQTVNAPARKQYRQQP